MKLMHKKNLSPGSVAMILLAVWLSVSPAKAEEPPKAPTPPFLAEITKPVSITRDFEGVTKLSKEPKTETPRTYLIRTTTEIYEPVRRVLFYYSGGSPPVENWVSQGVMLSEVVDAHGYVQYDAGAAAGTGSDLVAIFPEAKWVDRKTFVKWETVDDQLCRVHKTVIPPTRNAFGDINTKILSGPVTVWIDDVNRRPVKVTTAQDTILLTYGPGPTSPFNVPPAIASTLQQIRYGPGGQMR